MCKIKTGVKVISQADVRNLITAIILRQKNPFEKKYIISLTEKNLDGSSYSLEDGELQIMVDEHLDLYCRNKELKCINGKYVGIAV